MRGSKPNSNVQLGVSITLSRLMNSCTRIAPMVLPLSLTARLPDGFPAILHLQAAGLEGFRGQDLIHSTGPGAAGFEQVVSGRQPPFSRPPGLASLTGKRT